MIRHFIAAVLFVCLAVTSVSARADEASHLKAAQDLLVVCDMQNTLEQAITQMLDMQAKQMPGMDAYKDAMKTFFEKYIGWDAMKDDVAKIYASSFTEDELKEITAFYQTPTGKKTIKLLPSLMMQSMQLSQQRVQAHIGELQAIMADIARKNADAKGAPPPPVKAQ